MIILTILIIMIMVIVALILVIPTNALTVIGIVILTMTITFADNGTDADSYTHGDNVNHMHAVTDGLLSFSTQVVLHTARFVYKIDISYTNCCPFRT